MCKHATAKEIIRAKVATSVPSSKSPVNFHSLLYTWFCLCILHCFILIHPLFLHFYFGCLLSDVLSLIRLFFSLCWPLYPYITVHFIRCKALCDLLRKIYSFIVIIIKWAVMLGYLPENILLTCLLSKGNSSQVSSGLDGHVSTANIS